MPERLHTSVRPAPLAHRWALRLLTPVLLASTLLTSACTEELEGGAGCPLLCPQQQAPFRDTVIDAIVLDTTLGPYPVLGVSAGALLASRGDTLETHVIVRFDQLPDTYAPNGGAVTEGITTVDSTFLRFFVDTLGTRATEPFTLEVFDVDTTEADSVAAVVQSLFRPDRKVGELQLDSATLTDSLRIPIDREVLRARIEARSRLRLGVRIAPGANAQMRVGALVAGQPVPRLTFDPASDTTYIPLDVVPSTVLQGAESDEVLRLAYTVYTLTVRGAAPRPAGALRVGGYPADRAYLRVNIPSSIIDSSTIVRAELLLTQRPSADGPDRGDSVGVQPFVGIARSGIQDLYFTTALAANGQLAGVDSLVLVPRDSGQRVFNIVTLVRGWRTLDADVPRFLALRIGGEGTQGAQVLFHDGSAAAALRPRLRLTYLPRTEIALP
ncbi:MAG TPA: hypothetical protein PKE51_04080 [Gemmatimonadaceae bacterium]|nr:hypothetical protein [Gemmatimonadaceae bacterium]